MVDQSDPLLPPLGTADAYRRSAYLAIPFLLLVPLAYALWFHRWGVSLSWPAIGAGALGWYVAFVLRIPVVLVARLALRTPECVQPWVVAASGPAEESVRLITLLLVGSIFPIALSVAWGGRRSRSCTRLSTRWPSPGCCAARTNAHGCHSRSSAPWGWETC
jgi:hypothetical protein